MTERLAARRALSVPWGAWTDQRLELDIPDKWEVVELAMRDAPALADDGIEAALNRPLDAPSLDALARSATQVAIAIDDITRPTRTAPILRHLVKRLEAAGVSRERVTIVIATGAHRQASERDVRLKVGDLAGRVRVVSHDPVEGVIETGVALAGTPVRVNREFLRADLRIGVCGVMPHPFAGFSGGGKIVLPGLSDLDAVVRSHKYALMGLAGGLQLDGNRFRADMERAVRQIGIDWTVNAVMNSRCETAAIVAGDVVAAHRAAASRATDIGTTIGPDRPLDALLLNAYPKDSELLQIEAALVAVRAGMTEWLHATAPVVLLGACPDGLGSHQLFGPGGRLFRTPTAKGYLRNRPLHIFSPATPCDETRAAFWEGYPYHETWDGCVGALAQALGSQPVIGYARGGPLHVPLAASATAVPPVPDTGRHTSVEEAQ